jgi:hypothetical protein
MITADDKGSSKSSRRSAPMKKLATLMLALTFAFGTMAVTFAQDAPKKEDTTKTKKSKKKKKEDAPKKEGGTR